MQYNKHKLNIFPEMAVEDYERLKADILKNGYDESQPIWLFENAIIDGWNRQKVCNELGIVATYRQFEGNELDAINFVMRTNKRRNLTSSQWAAIAVEAEDIVAAIEAAVEAERRAKIAARENVANQYTSTLEMGQLIAPSPKPDHKEKEAAKSRAKIAETFNTNRQYISDAKKLKTENPDAFERIKRGETTITEVKKEAKIAERQQLIEAKKAEPIVSNKDWFVHGDSREETKNAPDGIKLIFTDPPYGMDFQSNRRVQSPKAMKIENDSSIQDAIQLFQDVMSNLIPKLQDNSAALVWCSFRDERYFADSLIKLGLEIKNSIIWVRPNHGTGDLEGSFAPKHDRLLFAVKGRPILAPRLPDVLYGDQFLKTEHPTKKPIDLIQKVINSLTMPGDLVADPFAGSCSVGVPCLKTGRRFWGCELEKLYWVEGQTNLNNIQ